MTRPLEILREACDRWSRDLDRCDECGGEWPEYVVFRGSKADALLAPSLLKPVVQQPGDSWS